MCCLNKLISYHFNIEYFKMQKGGTGLIYNGQMVIRKTNSKTFFRCSDRKIENAQEGLQQRTKQ